ncbi:MAG: Wzz/FepE/Etk N-terminal domain-containing protein [Ardenticatenaceae bacterium]|nr:Wzz/FepE/Etk N-terminal domain-containing protein [Ardenticatenaceae bacterium]HBY94076.1 hypothetical protein [Chloroflexota bacterium]
MELREYWRIIVRRGWIVVLMAVIAAGSAYAWSMRQTPVYRASVLINVTPGRLDWGLQQTVKQVMRNYAQQIKSTPMAQRVVDSQKLDISPGSLRDKITVSPIEENLTMQLDAQDSDPEVAIGIANAVAEQFVDDIAQFNLEQKREERVDVSILEPASWASQIAPKPKINAVAAGLLGALVGGLLVLVLEFLDDTIKSRDDVRRYIGDLMVLGAIPPGDPALEAQATREAHERRRLGLSRS